MILFCQTFTQGTTAAIRIRVKAKERQQQRRKNVLTPCSNYIHGLKNTTMFHDAAQRSMSQQQNQHINTCNYTANVTSQPCFSYLFYCY
mmetsp:Transcript_115390/g.235949  ORF Transcript_115390/g.235949 Transcript_115390/m.235949 type:complete len:89 (-) Transcript_115390:216-482(-)